MRSASDKMYRLHELGKVEKIRVRSPSGGRMFRWRRIPEGYQPPLYDPLPGWDTRALAECLGGYTYTNHVPTGGKLYEQFD